VLPPPPPLRTGLETFASHGSSKSHTARILKIISRWTVLGRSKLSLGFLLVAEQMYQFSVTTRIRAIHGSWYCVMAMKLFTIDEIHATESADPALVVGHVDVPGAQVFCIHLLRPSLLLARLTEDRRGVLPDVPDPQPPETVALRLRC
jgi:hypothetical protein